MSYAVGERVAVDIEGLGPEPVVGTVTGILGNRPDWYNIRMRGYICAVHEGRLSREA